MTNSKTERRRRFVYVTRNSEYHVFDDVCVGVRDKYSGQWCNDHGAIRNQLEGGARVLSNGAVVPTLRAPTVGDPIYFSMAHSHEDDQIITSRLLSVARPRRADLTRYPAA